MKFEFSLPRNTKLKSLNMVINSNDRQHQTDKAKVTKRIRAFAYWHTSMNKDKGRAAFSPSNPCEVTVTIYSPTKSKLDPPKLEDALHYACSNGSREFTEWYQKKSNRDLFARAWLDGYEVEKEKRLRRWSDGR